jgi:hypothetical protein
LLAAVKLEIGGLLVLGGGLPPPSLQAINAKIRMARPTKTVEILFIRLLEFLDPNDFVPRLFVQAYSTKKGVARALRKSI